MKPSSSLSNFLDSLTMLVVYFFSFYLLCQSAPCFLPSFTVRLSFSSCEASHGILSSRGLSLLSSTWHSYALQTAVWNNLWCWQYLKEPNFLNTYQVVWKKALYRVWCTSVCVKKTNTGRYRDTRSFKKSDSKVDTKRMRRMFRYICAVCRTDLLF